MWRKALTIMVVGLALAGCLPSQQQLAMERDVAEMKRRLAEVERGTAALRQGQPAGDRVDVLARAQADQQASFDALRVELQSVAGRFEELKRERTEIRDDMSLAKDDLSLKLTALEDRVTRLETGAAARPAASSVAQTPEALYEQGVEFIQKRGEFARGRETLQDFLNRFPQHALAVNAMYWMGEAYYGEKKYENAILQFQDVIQKFGDHPKVASAMLKQGMAFSTLGDRKNARVILQRLIGSFPLSEEAKKARELLAEWDRKA
ncbi:MAG: tol-pal system protein YbgF [Desulfuromonadales bacterium]|nr:tol-pal system protein YbgF [Desulfuromonadales bacterium]